MGLYELTEQIQDEAPQDGLGKLVNELAE